MTWSALTSQQFKTLQVQLKTFFFSKPDQEFPMVFSKTESTVFTLIQSKGQSISEGATILATE